MRANPFSLMFLLIALLAMTAGCATNPVTGKRSLSLMSEGQERAIGAENDQGIVAQYGLVPDAALTAYVAEIGERMVPVSHLPNLDFNFRLLDDPIVNAFALPGGYVYITRGILAYLNSEAALAGVVGHEIGHVTARHGADRYTKQILLGATLGIGSLLSENFASVADLAGGAGQLLLLKHGRDDERQSDQLGVQYATALGYDTTDMAEFFQTLDRLSPGDGRLPGWMSTHPDPGERWNTVRALTQQEQPKHQGPFVTRRDEFLRKIDGIVFGPDPREGYFEGDLFHHPELRFRFPVPRGWQKQNGKSQVVMVEPQQAAAVIFQSAGKEGPAAAADAFVAQTKAQVIERSAPSIAGRPGVRVVSKITGQQGVQVVISSFFTFGDGTWVFHGLTSEAGLNTWRTALVQSADGFREETDPAVLGAKPWVVRVIEAPGSGSFAQVLTAKVRPGSGVENVEALAILNGMQVDSPVTRGQLVKVVERRN